MGMKGSGVLQKRGIWLTVMILAAVMLPVFVLELSCALRQDPAILQFWRGTYVGLRNVKNVFSRLVEWEGFLRNTVFQSLLTAGMGVMLGGGAAALLGRIPSRTAKAAFAGAALLVALLPELLYALPVGNVMMDLRGSWIANGMPEENVEKYYFWSSFFLGRAVPQMSICIFAGLSLHLRYKSSAVLGAVLAGMLPLLTLFLPDVTISRLSESAYIYGKSPLTLSYHSWIVGMSKNPRWSDVAASLVVGRVFSVVVGMGPALGMAWLYRRETTVLSIPMDKKQQRKECIAASAMGFLVVGAIVCWRFIGVEMETSVLPQVHLNTWKLAAIVACFSFVCCLTFLTLIGKCGRGHWLALGLILLLLAQWSVYSSVVEKYIMYSESWIRVLVDAAGVLGRPMFITILLVLLAMRPDTWKEKFLLAAGGGFAGAAFGIGDFQVCYATSRLGGSLYSLLMESVAEHYKPISPWYGHQDIRVAHGTLAALMPICIILGAIAVVFIMAGIGRARQKTEKKRNET